MTDAGPSLTDDTFGECGAAIEGDSPSSLPSADALDADGPMTTPLELGEDRPSPSEPAPDPAHGSTDKDDVMHSVFAEICSLVDYPRLLGEHSEFPDDAVCDVMSLAELAKALPDDASVESTAATSFEDDDSCESLLSASDKIGISMPSPVQRRCDFPNSLEFPAVAAALLDADWDAPSGPLQAPAVDLLYSMQHKCQQTGQSARQLYSSLRKPMQEHFKAKKQYTLRAHCDGGASASTTNRIEFLWFCRRIRHMETVLKVADGARYSPTHEGYLCVPSRDGQHQFVPCFFTPEIEATILSPFRTCTATNCRGVSTYVSRDQSLGEVTIHHPKRTSQDIVFTCSVFQGLLYTEPLIKPSAAQMHQPLPRPVVHIERVVEDKIMSLSAQPNDDPLAESCQSGNCSCAACHDPAGVPDDPGLAETDAVHQVLHDQFLHYIRLGCQDDVNLHSLSRCTDGVPDWSLDPSTHVCGPSCLAPADGDTDSVPPDTDSDAPGTGEDALEDGAETSQPGEDSLTDEEETSETGEDGLAAEEGTSQPGEDSTAPVSYRLCHLSREQALLLWHQRMGHMSYERVREASKKSIGPPVLPTANDLDNCPVCQRAKLHHAARSQESSRRAEEVGQGISIDFGFVVQRSSADSRRVSRFEGINGETCYCLITDHYSGMLWGDTFSSKRPPIDFLNRWLVRFGLPADSQGANGAGKYVRWDLGELGSSREVNELFQRAGYSIEPTAPDSSASNGPGERPHRTIKNALRAMLAGAGLEPKFWPFAFHHFLRLYNMVPHAGREHSPYQVKSGKVPDMRHLRVFGCRLFALDGDKQKQRQVLEDAQSRRDREGVFLGFQQTQRNIIYYDHRSAKVKTTQHAVFDETESDLPERTPNAELLLRLRTPNAGPPHEIFDAELHIPDLDISLSPFTGTTTLEFPLRVDDDHPLGFVVGDDDLLHRAFVERFLRPPQRKTLRSLRRGFNNSYVVKVGEHPIHSAADFQTVVESLCHSESAPDSVSVELAPERRAALLPSEPSMVLRSHDLHHISASLSPTGEDMPSWEDPVPSEAWGSLVHRLQTADMTDEERKLKSFTRRNLKKLSNWPEWQAAFMKQLDAHHDAGTLAAPVKRSEALQVFRELKVRPVILRFQWSNLVKPDGTRKSRACADGSKRAAPWLRAFGDTYASCIATPCMRMFFALIAAQNYTVTVADTSNAFQQSPPPAIPRFMEIDEAYCEWYKQKHGTEIDPREYVIPVERALQGDPSAGFQWETYINKILLEELGFINTTHERNLYRGKIDGEDVLLCRQVDDFAVGCADPGTAEKFIKLINDRVTTDSKGMGEPLKLRGHRSAYNGIDLYQTRDYVKVACDTYIERLLQTHGWDSPEVLDKCQDVSPIVDDLARTLHEFQGPAEDTKEHRELRDKMGFSYRQLLGELMYAYVVARPDIGFAVCLLARFSASPHEKHYRALEAVAKHLGATKDWGIVYWRTAPNLLFEHVPLEQPELDASLPEFPQLAPTTLVGFVDAAHATDMIQRKSVTGLVFTLAGGAIAYKSKLQATIATSSTEAELIAAVTAAKMAKYLRSVLHQLGFPQDGPTLLHEDNQAVINIVNCSQPTSRTRHVAVQTFAIQEWRAKKQIKLDYISTDVNVADDLTKGLGWTLHSRHVRRMMGHICPSYAVSLQG